MLGALPHDGRPGMQHSHLPGNGKYPHGRTGWRRVLHTLVHSRDGLLATYRGEAAFRQLLVLHTLLVGWAFLLDLAMIARALLLAVCLLSLVVELLNSAIEAVVDRISLEHHPLSRNAKDMGSAAQSVTLVMVAAVWAMVLLG